MGRPLGRTHLARLRPLPGLISPNVTDWDGLKALGWQGLLRLLEPWTKRYPDVEVTYYVEPEGSTKVLLRHAAEAQLVVFGNRRDNALAGAVLGSTSLNLLQHSPVPIMLFVTGDPAPDAVTARPVSARRRDGSAVGHR